MSALEGLVIWSQATQVRFVGDMPYQGLKDLSEQVDTPGSCKARVLRTVDPQTVDYLRPLPE